MSSQLMISLDKWRLPSFEYTGLWQPRSQGSFTSLSGLDLKRGKNVMKTRLASETKLL